MNKNLIRIVVAMLALTAFATGCSNKQTGTPVLTNLELGFWKTNLEYVPIGMDQEFSSETRTYSVTTEVSRTDSIVITPFLREGDTLTRITINDTEVEPGLGYKVDLSRGDNFFSIIVSEGKRKSAVYNLRVTQEDLSAIYKSELVTDGVWRIWDFAGFSGNENFYLVEGKVKAVLFDTGMGKGDLAGYIRGLTNLPIEVAITHGHGDHFMQVDQFRESIVYVPEKDLKLIPAELITPKFKTVKSGDVIDLGGGRKFEVFELPGHTPGCSVYIDLANKLAVTGDAPGSGDRVHAYNIPFNDLKKYAAALRVIEDRLKDLNEITLLTGHYYQEKTPLTGATGKQFFTDMCILTEKVLSGEIVGKTAYTVRNGQVRELRQAYYGLGGLWYNPNN